ncbi:MAG TPA: carbohydrate-binding family 9-like protein, partial [Armatimonadota bacterium]|nr:carbohydrate-binding family 9-like protein [Armatimonadota bacterium]
MLRQLLLLCLIATSAYPQSAKVVTVPKTQSRINIDGRLSEVAWKTAGMIPEFQEYRGSAALRNQTQVRLLYDDQALYIAYRCKEADISRIRAQVTDHDGSVWDDDCAEFFLDVKADRASFAQFILNT